MNSNSAHWSWGRLSDCIGLLKSGLSRRIEAEDIGVPVLISGNIQDNKLDVSELKYWYLNDPQGAKVENYFLDDNDILLCFINSVDQIGKLCIYRDIGRPAIYTTNLFRIKSKSEYDSVFLYYLLTSDHVQNWIKLIVKPAVNQASFTTGDFLKIPVPIVREKKEQQKIAKILTTVDNLIEKTEALIEKYQAIKQGMMHDLFTRGIDTNGQLRPSHHDAPHLYKQTELGWIPKEWDACTWRELVTYSCYGPRFNAENYSENGNARTIRGMDFTKEGDILYEQVPLALLPNLMVIRHSLEDNDVIVVTTADCGVTAVFHEQKHKYIPSAYTVKFRFNQVVLPYFIKYYMQTDLAKRQVNKYVRQGTLGNLPGSDLLKFWIRLPEIQEQQRVIDQINTLQNKIKQEGMYLSKLKKTKQGLMQDLLTGKVRVG